MTGPAYAPEPDIVFAVDNTRVRVTRAPQAALRALYDGLAYLTPSAADAGFQEAIPADEDVPEEATYQWDGMRRFLRKPTPRVDGSSAPPWFETGLLPRAMALVGHFWRVAIADYRTRPDPNHDVPLWFADASKPLRDYQETAVRNAEREGRGIIIAPPRAGKTRIGGELIRRLNTPTLWVAPTTSIIDQTIKALVGLGLPEAEVRQLGGGWKPADKAKFLWIGTAAAALDIPREYAQTRGVVFIDELHHFTSTGAWGRKLHRQFPHVFHWFGATGTPFRSGADGMDLEAFLSGVVFQITPAELVQRGILVPTRLAFLPVDGTLRRGLDHIVHGIREHDGRNALAAAAALHLASIGRRVLVMASVKKQGNMIAAIVNHHGPRTRRGGYEYAEFLYRGRGGTATARDMEFRRKMIGAFLDGTGPAVLIGTSLLGEGVDLPDCDAIIWARGESAAVSYIQGMYRVSTAAPGKTSALAVDFADRHHPKLLEASLKRLQIAYSDPVFEVSNLRGPEHLAAWAAGAR